MRRLLIFLAVLLVLVAADTALWRWGEGRLAAGLAAWAAARRAAGWEVSYASPTPSGWPFAAALTVPDVSLAGVPAGWPAALSWKAERITLRVGLWHPQSLVIDAAAPQHLRFADAFELPLTADTLQLSLPLLPGRSGGEATLGGTNLRIGLPGEGQRAPLTIALLTGTAAAAPATGKDQAGWSFALSAEEIGVPATAAGGTPLLGSHIASASVAGEVRGPLPAGADTAAQAAAWRDGGGVLQINRLALGWGPLGLTGRATLTLDAQLQPAGSGTITARGQNETLNALAAEHVISPATAQAAEAVLGLLARTPAGGGAPQIEVPLTLRDGTLAVGHIPLLRIGKIVWPARGEPANVSP